MRTCIYHGFPPYMIIPHDGSNPYFWSTFTAKIHCIMMWPFLRCYGFPPSIYGQQKNVSITVIFLHALTKSSCIKTIWELSIAFSARILISLKCLKSISHGTLWNNWEHSVAKDAVVTYMQPPANFSHNIRTTTVVSYISFQTSSRTQKQTFSFHEKIVPSRHSWNRLDKICLISLARTNNNCSGFDTSCT
jgi:hypothetical protein